MVGVYHLYVGRHGPTGANKAKVFQDNRDFSSQNPLDLLIPEGEDDVRKLERHFQKFRLDILLASPLPRALQSSCPFFIRSGLYFETNKNLVEMYLGELTGQSYAHIPDVNAYLRCQCILI